MPTTPAPKSDQRDLFRGALEMMILQSVRRQPMHGYALVQYIKQRSNALLQVEEGSLYPALQRLLKENLVKAQWETSASNRRVRNGSDRDFNRSTMLSGAGCNCSVIHSPAKFQNRWLGTVFTRTGHERQRATFY